MKRCYNWPLVLLSHCKEYDVKSVKEKIQMLKEKENLRNSFFLFHHVSCTHTLSVSFHFSPFLYQILMSFFFCFIKITFQTSLKLNISVDH